MVLELFMVFHLPATAIEVEFDGFYWEEKYKNSNYAYMMQLEV